MNATIIITPDSTRFRVMVVRDGRTGGTNQIVSTIRQAVDTGRFIANEQRLTVTGIVLPDGTTVTVDEFFATV